MRHLWVIEWFNGTKWVPTLDCSTSRSKIRAKRQEIEADGDVGPFRVTKYHTAR